MGSGPPLLGLSQGEFSELRNRSDSTGDRVAGVLNFFRQEREVEQVYASGQGPAPLNHDGEVDPQITNEASCRGSVGHLIRFFGIAGYT